MADLQKYVEKVSQMYLCVCAAMSHKVESKKYRESKEFRLMTHWPCHVRFLIEMCFNNKNKNMYSEVKGVGKCNRKDSNQ